jgi:hypothetical protein
MLARRGQVAVLCDVVDNARITSLRSSDRDLESMNPNRSSLRSASALAYSAGKKTPSTISVIKDYILTNTIKCGLMG